MIENDIDGNLELAHQLRVYDHGMEQIAAFILAGGKSSRMGSDKALLELHGETLLSRMLKLARAVTGAVHVVGDAKKFAAFAPVVEDTYRERGPLGGIHAALAFSVCEWNLILAVDLPFVRLELLGFLIARGKESAAVVTVPRTGEGWQPLCAVYRREFSAVSERALSDGKNKIDPLFGQVKTTVIDEHELQQAGFSAAMFRNLNTRNDLEEAEAFLRENRAQGRNPRG